MSRPLFANIDLAALRNNFAVARRHAEGARAWAVIKANGYGHGMLRVARALADADGFAVLAVGEAAALRDAGIDKPILLLEGFFQADELPLIAKLGVATVIHCVPQLEALLAAHLPAGIDVFLKLNTGMNRLGFPPAGFGGIVERLQGSRNVASITLMTHFATADEPAGIGAQLECFESAARGLDLPRCLANSAALLRYPQARGAWVRPGIMLYGSSPFADRTADALGLQPVMTLSSRIIGVQQVAAGERVGYGGTFRAERPARVGVVACGYADGYPRHAGTGTPILVCGKRTGTVGRVSMDMLCVDLTDIPEAAIGSPVVLWGQGMPVDEVAAAAGTISYELLCALAPRVRVSET